MSLLDSHQKVFHSQRPIIGCLHLMAMPGTPYYDRSVTIEQQISRIHQEAEILQKLGYDAVVFANEGDRPYLSKVGPEIIAAYVRIASAVIPDLSIPYGCGVLIDPIATLAVAKGIGAKFVRTYVSNSYEGTFGSQKFFPAEIFRYQKHIEAEDVRIYTYFEAHAGVSLDTRDLNSQISSGFASMPLSGMLIGGPRAGLPPEQSTLAQVKENFPDYPLLLGSGGTPKNIASLLKYTDGVIIGTNIKKDGYLYNPVDKDRAKAFIEAAKSI
ncbi:MAG: BtpA/SgcQ family protein [Anaerolineaceae bacterium]|nr:BtpA/SgcQ family protein [Anaerolineaceae bacterium]